MDPPAGQGGAGDGGKDGKGKKEKGKPGGSKTTTGKLKERWLLTRKTWRYMSDAAGKKLFPEGVNPKSPEDVPKVEEHFQNVSSCNREYVLWPPVHPPQQSPRAPQRRHRRVTSVASDTSEDYGGDTDDDVLSGGASGGAFSPPPGGFNTYPRHGGRERLMSLGELPYQLPPEIYAQLLRSYDYHTLNRVSSRLLEEQLMEEDEFDYEDELEEAREVDGCSLRDVGAQTDSHLDMCVQTDDDLTAEDMVKVGFETKSVTEANVAMARETPTSPTPTDKSSEQPPQGPPAGHHGGGAIGAVKKLWARRESSASKQDEPTPPSTSPEPKKGSGKASAKDREAPPPKGGVAAKLAWAEKNLQGGPPLAPGKSAAEQNKKQDKSKLKNVFKLGLKCDIDQAGFEKKTVETEKVDKFKMVNYDKTLRDVKSKWVPGCGEPEPLDLEPDDSGAERQQQFFKKDSKKSKLKQKVKAIQVGDPLPQFILKSLRISTPVEIIHQRVRRRKKSKAESSDFSSSELDMSFGASCPTSPRYSISVTDDHGTRSMLVSEPEATRLREMGAKVEYKRPSIDASVGTSEFDLEAMGMGGIPPGYQRSLSELQASGYLHQLMVKMGGRGRHPQRGGGIEMVPGIHKDSHGLLQSLLPSVMQRSRSGGSGGHHAPRLVAKKMWRPRSKSQSRASAGTTSIWTPMGGCVWTSVTGRMVTLENTTLPSLTELERLTLQRLAVAKLQALNLGCQIRVPTEGLSGGEKPSGAAAAGSDGSHDSTRSETSTAQKKRRPYLLKRKALSTGFFDSKKDENKGGSGGTTGMVFGLPLNKCLENERLRSNERAAEALAAANLASQVAADAEAAALGHPDLSLSRKASLGAASHASFSSLNEAVTKQSSTGSLESLNLERKRPSLVGSDLLGPPGLTTPDLLTVETTPQIPGLVSQCFSHLESTGLHTLGIFRVSSSKKRVRQLREEFDSGKDIWLTEDHCPHDIATLLKEFFRDLPAPLLTRELYEPLIRTQKIRNRKLQFEALQHLIQLLPVANRDTLYSLLNFLTLVAEHSGDQKNKNGEVLQGNKMDSSNLATLFAPNILHSVKPGSLTTEEMTAHAEERIEVINVIRSMIDHNKELFEVPVELLDETYQHLMDTHPDALDILLRRRCQGPDDFDLEIDTSSSVFEGSECSSSLPRSPTDHFHHDFDRLRQAMEDAEVIRSRRREDALSEITGDKSDRKQYAEDEEIRRGRCRVKSGESPTPNSSEERGSSWFRKREKSSSRDLDRTSEERQPEKSRWFRKREKSSTRGHSDKYHRREEAEQKSKDRIKSKEEANGRRRSFDTRKSGRPPSLDKGGNTGVIVVGGEKEKEYKRSSRSSSDQTVTNERLRVPEPTVRRLSSPEIDNAGVITASLRIPVPLSQGQQTSAPLAFTQDSDIPYIEDTSHNNSSRHGKKSPHKIPSSTNKESKGDITRQRSGSNDSYLGQPITGTMSFQPLNKKGGDKQSYDSVLSTSSADAFTLSPSPRNTPSSDILYASGTSSPLSGAGSPPPYISPDSGTPGLSPPNSPPPVTRRRGQHVISHSVTHTFGTRNAAPLKSRISQTQQTSTGMFPMGRSKTSDSFPIKDAPSRDSGDFSRSVVEKGGGRVRHPRRRYATERHPTGHLPDLSDIETREAQQQSGDTQTQLWKRWEIIASDPTEPETFV